MCKMELAGKGEGAEGNLTTVQLDDLAIELSKASILLSHRRCFVVKNFIP